MSLRIIQRSDPDDFARLLGQRRDDFADGPLLVREQTFRGEWRVVATLGLACAGLVRIHELRLVRPVGHLLDVSVPPADAWPTHAAARAEVRDVVRRGVSRGGWTWRVTSG
ncbi:MAG: hypothetical protein AAGL98_08335 [Planctomycetota bacterium]